MLSGKSVSEVPVFFSNEELNESDSDLSPSRRDLSVVHFIYELENQLESELVVPEEKTQELASNNDDDWVKKFNLLSLELQKGLVLHLKSVIAEHMAQVIPETPGAEFRLLDIELRKYLVQNYAKLIKETLNRAIHQANKTTKKDESLPVFLNPSNSDQNYPYAGSSVQKRVNEGYGYFELENEEYTDIDVNFCIQKHVEINTLLSSNTASLYVCESQGLVDINISWYTEKDLGKKGPHPLLAQSKLINIISELSSTSSDIKYPIKILMPVCRGNHWNVYSFVINDTQMFTQAKDAIKENKVPECIDIEKVNKENIFEPLSKHQKENPLKRCGDWCVAHVLAEAREAGVITKEQINVDENLKEILGFYDRPNVGANGKNQKTCDALRKYTLNVLSGGKEVKAEVQQDPKSPLSSSVDPLNSPSSGAQPSSPSASSLGNTAGSALPPTTPKTKKIADQSVPSTASTSTSPPIIPGEPPKVTWNYLTPTNEGKIELPFFDTVRQATTIIPEEKLWQRLGEAQIDVNPTATTSDGLKKAYDVDLSKPVLGSVNLSSSISQKELAAETKETKETKKGVIVHFVSRVIQDKKNQSEEKAQTAEKNKSSKIIITSYLQDKSKSLTDLNNDMLTAWAVRMVLFAYQTIPESLRGDIPMTLKNMNAEQIKKIAAVCEVFGYCQPKIAGAVNQRREILDRVEVCRWLLKNQTILSFSQVEKAQHYNNAHQKAQYAEDLTNNPEAQSSSLTKLQRRKSM